LDIPMTVHEAIDSMLENTAELFKELHHFLSGSLEEAIVGTSKYMFRSLKAQEAVQAKVAHWKENDFKAANHNTAMRDGIFSVGLGPAMMARLMNHYELIKLCVLKQSGTISSKNERAKTLLDRDHLNLATELAALNAGTLTVAQLKAVLVPGLIQSWKAAMIECRPFNKIGSHQASAFITCSRFITAILQRFHKNVRKNANPPDDLAALTSTGQEYSRLLVSWNMLFWIQYEQLRAFAAGHNIAF